MKLNKHTLCLATLLCGFNAFATPTVPDNTYLVYANVVEDRVPQADRQDFFKRLLTYVDQNGNSQDAFMDGFVFMQSTSYFSYGGQFGDCTNSANCGFNNHVTDYVQSHFGSGGYLDLLAGADQAAQSSIGSDFRTKVPQVKVYFSIPYPQSQAVNGSGTANSVYMDKVEEYLKLIRDEFNQWKGNNTSSTITMAGFYFARESLKTTDGKYLLPSDGNSQTGSFMVDLKQRLSGVDANFTLVSSPYQNYYPSGSSLVLASSYQNREQSTFGGNSSVGKIFDKIWLQPNAFFGGFKWKDVVDKEVIRWTHSYYRDFPHTAYNIETRTDLHSNAIGKEFFPEVVNYADYAQYLGLNHYPVTYYDDGHAYYDLSLDSSRHWVYQQAYKLAKRGRDGDVVNGGFEHFDLVKPSSMVVNSTELSAYNTNKLLAWNGNFTIANNATADIDNFAWSTAGSDKPTIGSFYLAPGQSHKLSFNVAENSDDGTYWSGIAIWRFYDPSGNQIITGSAGNSSVKYSSYVNGWYHYVHSTTTNSNVNLTFAPPTGTVKTEVVLGKWGGSATLNWSNVSIKRAADNQNLYVMGKQNDGSFSQLDFYQPQQHANLSKSAYVESEQAFNVTGGLSYRLSFQSQLKNGGSCSGYNGVFGVKFYDQNNSLISTSANGLNWSSYLGLHYNYFVAKANLQDHLHGFTTPTQAVSAKVQLRNWNCNNDMAVDNIVLNETSRPMEQLSFAGEALGLDQNKLIRLNTQNPQARFSFDLTTGSFSGLNLLTRANCTNFADTSCSANASMQYVYLDASGNVIHTSSESITAQGKGEKHPNIAGGLLTYTHWNMLNRNLSNVSGAAKVNVIVTLTDNISSQELLISRPHLK
jgi:hypothetical protein